MSVQTEIRAQAVEILEPNLQFYRTGTADQSRYFIGPEILAALSWVITSIVVPVLVSGASEAFKEKIKDWLHKTRASGQVGTTLPDALRGEADAVMKQIPLVQVTGKQASEASEIVGEYLSHHGWPTPLATVDAAEIVQMIRQKLGR